MKGLQNMQVLRIFIVHALSALSSAVVYVLGIDYDGIYSILLNSYSLYLLFNLC
ncbi:hypothetical protein [Bacillus subtilis]|uniref:hypothetical protein n=1 Tax=Bacillus subtilis TaxID=1423 RepID=UPI00207BF556|nr:hypothetical protein [Bacillus subtilis]